MKNLLLVCLVTLLHWATSAAALRIFPSASSSPVLCEAEKRAISPGTEVRVATVRVDNTDKSFRIAMYGKNDIVSGSILAHGRWEPSTLEHLKTALAEREASVYLDIGANIGYFALYVAALGYKVIAVEASQENANLIRYSLCLNPELKSRIKLHHVALADKRMRCLLASPEGNVGEMVMDCKEVGRGIDVNNWFRKAREDTVNTVPLDEVVGKDERVDVLKIDTEGFEYHALVGGQKHVLPKIRSVFSEFSPFMLRKQHTDPVAYLELLRKHGLRVYYKGDIVRDFGKLVGSIARDSIVDITASRGAFEGSGNRREAGNNIGVSGAYLKPVTLFFDDVFRASQDQSSYFPIDVDLDCLPLWPKYHAGHEDNFKIGNADACLTFVDKAKWCEVTCLAVKNEKRPLVWLNFQSLWRHEAARGLSCPINNTFYTSTAFNKSAYNPRLHIPVPTPTFQNYRYPTSTSDVLARCREAKLLASFYGQIATEERKEIVRAFRNVSGTSVLDSGGYGAGGARMYELLLDSKFGLVPAGDGWHSYRLVEVMAMGVVPVVLSSQWILPFESSLDWKSFAIDARDTSLQKLPSLLRSELPRACDMGAKAYGVYHEYMATPSAIVRGIQKHVNAFSTP